METINITNKELHAQEHIDLHRYEDHEEIFISKYVFSQDHKNDRKAIPYHCNGDGGYSIKIVK